jgi:GH35 family endo-1,4-beta-xylanase
MGMVGIKRRQIDSFYKAVAEEMGIPEEEVKRVMDYKLSIAAKELKENKFGVRMGSSIYIFASIRKAYLTYKRLTEELASKWDVMSPKQKRFHEEKIESLKTFMLKHGVTENEL